MGLLSRFGGLFGRRPKSLERDSPAHNGPDRTSVTAELNHRIGPIDRGDRYEDPLEKALAERGYGEVDGGGALNIG